MILAGNLPCNIFQYETVLLLEIRIHCKSLGLDVVKIVCWTGKKLFNRTRVGHIMFRKPISRNSNLKSEQIILHHAVMNRCPFPLFFSWSSTLPQSWLRFWTRAQHGEWWTEYLWSHKVGLLWRTEGNIDVTRKYVSSTCIGQFAVYCCFLVGEVGGVFMYSQNQNHGRISVWVKAVRGNPRLSSAVQLNIDCSHITLKILGSGFRKILSSLQVLFHDFILPSKHHLHGQSLENCNKFKFEIKMQYHGKTYNQTRINK